ncbi:MAG: PhoH family protein [Desulfobacterales bacterium]|nr:PhoH family protein [Desulfobacterales bacterium]
MENHKQYIIDTNVLLEDPDALAKLRNGNENTVYIPFHVLLELDKFKKNSKLAHIVARVIQYLIENPEQYQILNSGDISPKYAKVVDHHILDEIQQSGLKQPILVTNDKIFQLQARLRGIQSEIYKESVPFKSEAEYFTGFVSSREELVPNAFMWNDQGKPIFFGAQGEKTIDYQHRIWKVKPRNIFQNLALELMTNSDIHIVSMQSDAGYGKSYLALATALYLVMEKKAYEKIFVVKPMIEIGQKLGYLPGRVEEKMEPYTRYISDLMIKLHRLRSANKVFVENGTYPPQFNSKIFEILPLAYIRGMNIENAVVIIDEMQNMSRAECRALLSRLGEGVKCICLGDINQVDNPYLNKENNGLNWIVKKFKGNNIYSHIVLKGDKSRGPITDLVISSGL